MRLFLPREGWCVCQCSQDDPMDAHTGFIKTMCSTLENWGQLLASFRKCFCFVFDNIIWLHFSLLFQTLPYKPLPFFHINGLSRKLAAITCIQVNIYVHINVYVHDIYYISEHIPVDSPVYIPVCTPVYISIYTPI